MILSITDVKPFVPTLDDDLVGILIQDAVSQASIVAGCLLDQESLTLAQLDQFRSILRQAITRWGDTRADSGKVVTQSETLVASPYTKTESQTVDNSANVNQRKPEGLFWPAELVQLEEICKSRRRSGTVDTTKGLSRGRRVGERSILQGL